MSISSSHTGPSASTLPKIGIIVNPAAGNGRGRRLGRRMRTAFAHTEIALSEHDVWHTQHRGHERELARSALQHGYDTLVVVGGDGTISHVANAMLAAGTPARLAPIAAGSGNDFVRSLAIPTRDLRAMARACAALPEHQTDQHVDVGCVEDEYFLNSCGFGFDVAVLQSVGNVARRFGRLSYLAAALRQLRAFPGFSAAIGDEPTFRHLLIVAANAPRFGGTFLIAPDASMYDGALDLIEMWTTGTVWKRFKLLAAATRGHHVRHLRNIRVTHAGALTVKFDTPPYCQTDGEVRQLNTKVVTMRCFPGALRIVGAPPPPVHDVHYVVRRARYAARQRP